jgi:hypothetical protein
LGRCDAQFISVGCGYLQADTLAHDAHLLEYVLRLLRQTQVQVQLVHLES